MLQLRMTQINSRSKIEILITNQLGHINYRVSGHMGFIGAKLELTNEQGAILGYIIQSTQGILPRFDLHVNGRKFGSFGLSLYTDAFIFVTGANWLLIANQSGKQFQIRKFQRSLLQAQQENDLRQLLTIYDPEHLNALLLISAFLIRWRGNNRENLVGLQNPLHKREKIQLTIQTKD